MENPGASKYHGLPARPLLRPSGHPSEQALEYHAILAAFKTVSSRKQGYGTKEYAEAADLPNFPQSRRFCRITSEQVSLRSAKGSFLRLHSGINAAKKAKKEEEGDGPDEDGEKSEGSKPTGSEGSKSEGDGPDGHNQKVTALMSMVRSQKAQSQQVQEGSSSSHSEEDGQNQFTESHDENGEKPEGEKPEGDGSDEDGEKPEGEKPEGDGSDEDGEKPAGEKTAPTAFLRQKHEDNSLTSYPLPKPEEWHCNHEDEEQPQHSPFITGDYR
jgi:hypothetical protein